jgi:hypothetical protein
MGTNNGNHRTKGAKTVLPQGVRAAIEACNAADEHDPLRKEAEGLILQIMRGERLGRYVQTQLSAAVYALERARGKPVQPVVSVQDRPREVKFPGGERYAAVSGHADPAAAEAVPAGGNGESRR